MKTAPRLIMLFAVAVWVTSCVSTTPARTRTHYSPSSPSSGYRPPVAPVSPPPPTVQGPADPSGERLARMRGAYRRFQYKEVVELAKRIDENPSATKEERAEAFVLSGASYVLTGDEPMALQYFGRARFLLPKGGLNAKLFPAKVVRVYNQAAPRNPNPGSIAREPVLETEPSVRRPPLPEVLKGVMTLQKGQQFSFALESPVPSGGDVEFVGWRGRGRQSLHAAGGTFALGNGQLDDIRELPEHETQTFWESIFGAGRSYATYQPHTTLVLGQRYAVRCADNRSYGAMRVLRLLKDKWGYYHAMTFEWRYRADGGRRLKP